jgi:farnesyl diphosphate synthase
MNRIQGQLVQGNSIRKDEVMSPKAFSDRISDVAMRAESLLEKLLENAAGLGEIARPALLMEAMRYTVLGGGKRLRPFLLVETAKMLGKSGEGPLRAGAALELLHCYSLVHDDLPAMDNDDLRRGKPTVHKAYDDGLAILVGDALLTLAFDVLADKRTTASASKRIELVQILARGAGCGGMVGGQLLDLAAEGRYPQGAYSHSDANTIIRIQSMKTGALIMAACSMGAIIAGASAVERKALEVYSSCLGLAFQIKDDLLDAEGNADDIGKATRKDATAGKATFVSLRGISGAKAYLACITAEAKVALEPFSKKATVLSSLMDFNSARHS